MIDRLPDRLDLYAMAEAGREMQGRVELVKLERVLPSLASREGELQVALKSGKDQDGTHYLSGSIQGKLKLQCQRCLEPLDYSLDLDFCLGLVRSQDEIAGLPERFEPLLVTTEPTSMIEVISDEVLLALPIVELHKDMKDCQQLETEYKASADSGRENPFAVLAQLKHKH